MRFLLIFMVLSFVGCKPQSFRRASVSLPSCDDQFSAFTDCFIGEKNTLSCEDLSIGGAALGEAMGEFCLKHTLAPSFQRECESVAKKRFGDFTKKFMDSLMQKCA